ncbi:MAG: ferritin-like domain-containing protein [Dehalococcoidales bacterium]|nr:MAG: ferritin-like domain-containing protein [Dehalococcoidales bacterium]
MSDTGVCDMQWNIISLKFMYNMERFATQIYLTQRRIFEEEWILKKITNAAENEQEHVKVLQKRILELQGSRSKFGFLFQTAGRVFGTITGLFGKKLVLKANVFVENRAIKDYRIFLNKVKFDEDTVQLVNRIIADEVYHKDTWELSLEELTGQEG